MPTFRVTIDVLHTMWFRTSATVIADSLEEAQNMLHKQEVENRYHYQNIDDIEQECLYDTCRVLNRYDNYVMEAKEHLLAGTGLAETDAQDKKYDTIYFPETENYEID